VRDLAKSGREIAQRQATDWAQLKAKHEEEKAALRQKQQAVFKNRQSFNRASQPAFYSWKAYQSDRAALKKQHAAGVQTLRARLKAQDAPSVLRFKDGQTAAWRTFYRLERADKRGQLDKALQAVTATPVGKHGPEHRDHLARVFNAKVDAGTRKVDFGQVLDTEKKAFFQGLAQKNAPTWATLKEGQQEQLIALRQRFDQSREAQRSRASTVTTAQDHIKQDRAELAAQQRSERAATKAKHATETAGQQKAWSDLNAERVSAWDGYRRDNNQSQERLQSGSWSRLAVAVRQGRVAGSGSENRKATPSAPNRSKPGRGPGRGPG
jgi:hypothetical protein